MTAKLCSELEFILAAVRHSPSWWQDERKNWCAYCGMAASTKDHIVPRCVGGSLKVPSCLVCNRKKKALSLQQFMQTRYFKKQRCAENEKSWTIANLWLAEAVALVKLAKLNPADSARAVRLKEAVDQEKRAAAKQPWPNNIEPVPGQAGVKFSATPLMQ